MTLLANPCSWNGPLWSLVLTKTLLLPPLPMPFGATLNEMGGKRAIRCPFSAAGQMNNISLSISPLGKYCGALEIKVQGQTCCNRGISHPDSESSICWDKLPPTSYFEGKSRVKGPQLSASFSLIAPIHQHWTFDYPSAPALVARPRLRQENVVNVCQERLCASGI